MSAKQLYFFVTNDISFDQRMHRICSALRESGYQVKLVGRLRKSSIPLSNFTFSTHRIKCLFNSGFLFYLEINIRFFFFALTRKFDLACAIDLDTLPGVALSSRLKRIPLAFDAHEWFAEVPELQGKSIKKKIWAWIERVFVPWASLRYTVNSSLAKIFEERLSTSFEVIRNVPQVQDAATASKAEKFVLIYQGALNKGRGLEPSILAMKQLPQCELWLVGEGDLSRELRKYVQELHLGGRVKFFGYQSPEKLKELTLRASLGLNLLESSSLNYYYSLANKFFDYMHAGIPSLNMMFPEYESILQEYPCGLMIAECTDEAIISAVNRIIEQPEFYNQMVKESVVAAGNFNWSNEKFKLVEMYDAVFEK